jgi:PAS domain-containing protein
MTSSASTGTPDERPGSLVAGDADIAIHQSRQIPRLRHRRRLRTGIRPCLCRADFSDNSDDAIFAKDPRGRYLLSNPAASRFVG